MRRNDNSTDLLICEEFYSGVGKNTKEGGGVAFEEAAGTFIALDVTDRRCQTSPAARIFRELRIRRLEQDLDPVKGCHDSFALYDRAKLARRSPFSHISSLCRSRSTYRTACQPTCQSTAQDIVHAPRLHLDTIIVPLALRASTGSQWGTLATCDGVR